jgi:pimeloyl-ACP methyl ester carboxylesterase
MRYVRSYPTDLAVLRDLLPGIQTPVLIIAGQRDDVVPAANAEFLHDRLPKSKLTFVDAIHFTWEDAADEYADLVVNWFREGLCFRLRLKK